LLLSDPSDAERFAAFINALFDSQGLTGAQAARRLRVAQSQVSRWRRGEGGISLENLIRIHETFGTDLDYLKGLAGFSASTPSIAQDDTDAALDALWEAERTAMREDLHDIPAPFHKTILDAVAAARRLAVDNARTAIELISTLPRSELASLLRPDRRDDDDDDRPKSGTLATKFALAGAG